jgi:hypothetical protein
MAQGQGECLLMMHGSLLIKTPQNSINYAVSVYPIQAPLPITQNALALSFLSFLRAFAGVS